MRRGGMVLFAAAAGAGVVAAAVALVLLAALAGRDGGWHFDGGGLGERLFVRGTLLADLGRFEPAAGRPVRYHVQDQDGTAPAVRTARHDSTRPAAEVVAHYARLCTARGFTVDRRVAPTGPWIACERADGWEIRVATEPASGTTRVIVEVWEPLR